MLHSENSNVLLLVVATIVVDPIIKRLYKASLEYF